MKTDTSPTMKYCPTCDEDREYRPESRMESGTIRGKQVTAEVQLLVCPACGDTQPDPFNDPLAALYVAYRKQVGLLGPADIKRIREQYGLSREAFAAVLGMSPASIYRYESGSLQDELHDTIIFACDDSTTMERLVGRRRNTLSSLQLRRFYAALQSVRAREAAETLPQLWLRSLQSRTAEKPQEWEPFQRRLHAATAYLRHHLHNVGEREIPNLLFLSELESQNRFGEPISGVSLSEANLLDAVQRFGVILNLDAGTRPSIFSAPTPAITLWHEEDQPLSTQHVAVLQHVIDEFHHSPKANAGDVLRALIVRRLRAQNEDLLNSFILAKDSLLPWRAVEVSAEPSVTCLMGRVDVTVALGTANRTRKDRRGFGDQAMEAEAESP